MKIISVAFNSNFYLEGVNLRKKLFFEGYANAQELIDDAYEKQSKHIIALDNNVVIGTGRLTLTKEKAIISQMTVAVEKQKQGVGKSILSTLISIALLSDPITIQLSARISAIPFYLKNNFKPTGKPYASQKTGIPHQLMVFQNQ